MMTGADPSTVRQGTVHSRRMLAGILTIATLALTGPVVGAAHAQGPATTTQRECILKEFRKIGVEYNIASDEMKQLTWIVEKQLIKTPAKAMSKDEMAKLAHEVQSEARAEGVDIPASTIDKMLSDLQRKAKGCINAE